MRDQFCQKTLTGRETSTREGLSETQSWGKWRSKSGDYIRSSKHRSCSLLSHVALQFTKGKRHIKINLALCLEYLTIIQPRSRHLISRSILELYWNEWF